jgi:hypothetical protein
MQNDTGKITITMLVSFVAVFLLASVFNISSDPLKHVQAQSESATTSVTVLNTPPLWDVNAHEDPESSATNPTNVGDQVVFRATGDDQNGEDYWLLICQSSTTPTANPNAPPECAGGVNDTWAISATTTDETEAIASYTALVGDAESNDWFGYICDANAGNPRCNDVMTNTAGQPEGSPFKVNHRPTFTVFSDDSPTDPGDIVTWTTTADDPDTDTVADTVKLFVCTTANFSTTTGCIDGTWATSTFSATNPSATTTIVIPTQDDNYEAYGYVMDNHSFAATGGSQGTDSVLTVNNVAPTVATGTFAYIDPTNGLGGPFALTTELGSTTGYQVQFSVEDNNSCEVSGGGNEISSVNLDFFRSGVTAAACNQSGEYNANECYTDSSANFVPSCTRVGGSCAGAGDSVEVWECTFPLWFIADPTDAGSPEVADVWLAAGSATDDDAATGPDTADNTVDGTGVELSQFMAFDVLESSIAYGSLEPGDDTGTLFATTTMVATGNTGLDELLSGDDMCTTYPSCTGNATSTIFIDNQEYAGTVVAYGAGTDASSTDTEFELDLVKSTSTTSPSQANTHWGIGVPGAVTFAGDYIGVNDITGVVAEAVDW